jgi:hypothetical protein
VAKPRKTDERLGVAEPGDTNRFGDIRRMSGFTPSAQLRVSSGGVAISTTEIGTERAMRAAILPGRAGAIRVTSQ